MVTGKKQKFWWQAAWKHSWLLLSYMALAFLLNQIIIYGNDTIAKAADQVLGGHQIALAGLLKALAVLAFAGAAAAFGKSFCSGVYNAVIQRDIMSTYFRASEGIFRKKRIWWFDDKAFIGHE